MTNLVAFVAVLILSLLAGWVLDAIVITLASHTIVLSLPTWLEWTLLIAVLALFVWFIVQAVRYQRIKNDDTVSDDIKASMRFKRNAALIATITAFVAWFLFLFEVSIVPLALIVGIAASFLVPRLRAEGRTPYAVATALTVAVCSFAVVLAGFAGFTLVPQEPALPAITAQQADNMSAFCTGDAAGPNYVACANMATGAATAELGTYNGDKATCESLSKVVGNNNDQDAKDAYNACQQRLWAPGPGKNQKQQYMDRITWECELANTARGKLPADQQSGVGLKCDAPVLAFVNSDPTKP